MTFSLTALAKDKAQVAFEHASQMQKSSRYDEALAEFQQIEQEFPYSNYAKLSKIKIADIHFEMVNYIQAQYQYQYYYDLYPKDTLSDYALYKSGLSIYKTLPRTIDRDLSDTAKVLKVWRTVLLKFPNTKYQEDILKKQKELLKNLGKKELYIAKFYAKKGKYISAQLRLNKLFEQFPSFKRDRSALLTAVKCAKGLDDNPAVKKYKNLLDKIQDGKRI